MRIKCLAQGHYCRCQQIRTGDLTIESPWSYPLSHNSSSDWKQVLGLTLNGLSLSPPKTSWLHWKTFTLLTCWRKLILLQHTFPIDRRQSTSGQVWNGLKVDFRAFSLDNVTDTIVFNALAISAYIYWTPVVVISFWMHSITPRRTIERFHWRHAVLLHGVELRRLTWISRAVTRTMRVCDHHAL